MTEERKRFDRLSFARIGKDILVDFEGFISPGRVRNYKDGAVRNFGVPLENVQRAIAAMYPEHYVVEDLPETNWLNVTMFDDKRAHLSSRLGKDIGGKDRVRIRVTGMATLNEFEGTKSIDVRGLDYCILWDKSMTGTKIGGRHDEPSYFYGKKIEDGAAHLAIQGYVNKPKLIPMADGHYVLTFGVAVSKRTDVINHTLGTSFSDDTVWMNVAVYDSDAYPYAQTSAQVLRHGAAIAGLGYGRRDEYDGKERVRFTLDSFNVLKYAKYEDDTEPISEKEPVAVGIEASSFDMGFNVDLLNDDNYLL